MFRSKFDWNTFLDSLVMSNTYTFTVTTVTCFFFKAKQQSNMFSISVGREAENKSLGLNCFKGERYNKSNRLGVQKAILLFSKVRKQPHCLSVVH